ncbi:acyltransferase family protein [Fictibacillus enclensis]|uniref:acyltransferase family protein n=1 Tax=Fictibacillus enclensis TaxID=1017270 RepID=UPI0024BF8065|nr:acyltransferase family protein [Fictibacillus enclensis]WHY71635.1 acyltransferase family protein [Fictibacillus enclensis]
MASKRIPWFDNIKGLLIFMVVFGHSIEIYRDWDGNTLPLYLYNAIYTFHMPLFIIISGYFYRPNKFKRTVQLFAVFLIWQLINGVLSKLINDQEMITLHSDSRVLDLLQPYWTMWFLLGIIVWGMITPYVTKLRFPLITAIALAIWVSYVNDVTTWFSLRKLVNFYPYFLIGYLLAEKNILKALAARSKTWKMPGKWVSASVILGFLGFMVIFTNHNWDTAITFMRDSYSHFEWSFVKGALIQIAIYVGVTVLSIAIMLLTSQDKQLVLFNKLGIYSIFIYLIHSSIVRVYRGLLPDQVAEHPIALIAVAALFALFTCWLITRKFIINLFKPLVEPKMDWLLRNEQKPQPSSLKNKEFVS